MKFAFCLFKYFPFGGLQRDFIRIANECVRRGHEVDVYCMHWEGAQDPSIKVTVLPTKGWQNHTQSQQFVKSLLKHLKFKKYDLIIGFNKMPELDVYYAADSCFQAKTKYGFWHRLTPRYRQLKKFEEAVFSSEVKTEIFLLAKRQQEEFIACYQTPVQRLHLLPPGISRDRIAPSNATEIRHRVRKKLNLTDNDLMLLMVGSGFKTKGLDRILLGFASLPDNLKKNSSLYIIGQDNPESFKKLSKKLNIAEQVVFLGGRHDVPEFLLAADLLVHPAYFENTGTVLLEALVAGLPVLTTDICGYSNYIREANAGIVIDAPYQQQALNQALANLLTSYDRENWRERAVVFAKHADIYSLVDSAVDLIEQFAKQKSQLSFDQYMALKGETFRELEGRSTQKITLNNKTYFIKQHHGVGWKEIIKNLLQLRLPVISARNEWQAIQKLNHLGIKTAKIVAYGCRGWNPAKRQSFILMNELRNTISLEELSKQNITIPLKHTLIKQVAKIARIMHKNGINHRDFYLCHFLMDRNDHSLYLLDMHRAQIRKKVPKRWLLKDLAGLYFSSKDTVLTPRDLLRFVKHYCDKPLRQVFQEEQALWQRVKCMGDSLYTRLHDENKSN